MDSINEDFRRKRSFAKGKKTRINQIRGKKLFWATSFERNVAKRTRC
jgi:hypothetical protein